MPTRTGPLVRTIAVLLLVAPLATACARESPMTTQLASVKLPSPSARSTMTLDEALDTRRSVRDFTPEALGPELVGQLLWAAQGITSTDGRRTAPSAGALYPLELYVVSGDGVFHYRPADHDLVSVSTRDVGGELAIAALDQEAVSDASIVIVIAADLARVAAKYGVERGERYALLEAGHAAQNVLLEAVALGLGAVPIGAFDDRVVSRVLGLPAALSPLYLIAIGHPAAE